MRGEDEPPEGALVIDTQSDKLGYVMGRVGPCVQLRPVTGGREWDAVPARVRLPTNEERLRAVQERIRALNSASSGGSFS